MILTLGVSHKTAPIEVREKLAFSQEAIPEALRALSNKLALEEVALLSTCNRTEFYCSASNLTGSATKKITSWWQEFQILNFDMKPYLYRFSDQHAVKHVMRLACGLDSMVIGEPQILGQLKTAFRTANQVGVLGKRLSRLFQTSFKVAKEIRASTEICTHPISIAFAAVALAKQIFSDLSRTTVLLVGAGENIELVLQHLLAKQVNRLLIINRTLNHAMLLADRYGATAYPLDDLTQCLAQADIVISSVSADHPILMQADLNCALEHTKRRPILMVDLGVPRNIDPNVALNEDVYLYTIDDLQGIIAQNLNLRQNAAQEAENRIVTASNAYMDWMVAEQQMVVLRNLRIRSDQVKAESLEQALRRLAKGDPPQAVVERMAHQLTQKLLHAPTSHLRKMSYEKAEEKIAIAKELFELE
ncbi:MAG: glutamyl-tRNA reductase [Candidatus Berkiellales bacterium]